MSLCSVVKHDSAALMTLKGCCSQIFFLSLLQHSVIPVEALPLISVGVGDNSKITKAAGI